MEFYNIYRATSICFSMFGAQVPSVFLYGAIVTLVVWSVFFVLQGVGLSTMAKKQGIKSKWQAFVPFANTLLIGKLAGECRLFSQRLKRAGLYATIAQIVTAVFCIAIAVSEVYLYAVGGMPKYNEWNEPYWTNLQGFSRIVFNFFDVSTYIFSNLGLVYEVLMLVLLLGLYKKYNPKHYTALGFLALFVPLSRYIVIFVLRNRKPVDFEAYARARYEAQMRQRGQYGNYGYGNSPYGNSPYGNSPYGNPYRSPYGAQTPPQEPEEPFAEFPKENGRNAPPTTEDTTNDSDEFFS